jgi:hypothetical protein
VSFDGHNAHISSAVDADALARFTEPTAQLVLENRTTGQKSPVVVVNKDGTFSASVPASADDALVVRVVDHSGRVNSGSLERLLTLRPEGMAPVVALDPKKGLPEQPRVSLANVKADASCIVGHKAATPGSLVTLVNTETQQKCTTVADKDGNFRLPAQVDLDDVFDIHVASPYASEPGYERDLASSVVRMVVGPSFGLKAAATVPYVDDGEVREAATVDRSYTHPGIPLHDKIAVQVSVSKGDQYHAPATSLQLDLKFPHKLVGANDQTKATYQVDPKTQTVRVTITPRIIGGTAVDLPKGEENTRSYGVTPADNDDAWKLNLAANVINPTWKLEVVNAKGELLSEGTMDLQSRLLPGRDGGAFAVAGATVKLHGVEEGGVLEPLLHAENPNAQPLTGYFDAVATAQVNFKPVGLPAGTAHVVLIDKEASPTGLSTTLDLKDQGGWGLSFDAIGLGFKHMDNIELHALDADGKLLAKSEPFPFDAGRFASNAQRPTFDASKFKFIERDGVLGLIVEPGAVRPKTGLTIGNYVGPVSQSTYWPKVGELKAPEIFAIGGVQAGVTWKLRVDNHTVVYDCSSKTVTVDPQGG